jgi:hypothetical protein
MALILYVLWMGVKNGSLSRKNGKKDDLWGTFCSRVEESVNTQHYSLKISNEGQVTWKVQP